MVSPAAAESKVYGLEHEIAGRTERVLVFADGPVTPRLERARRENSVLVLPGARLDASAPRRASIEPGGHVSRVLAMPGHDDSPDLEIQVAMARWRGRGSSSAARRSRSSSRQAARRGRSRR